MVKGSFSTSGWWTQLLMLLFLVLGGTVLFGSLGLLLGTLIYDASVGQLTQWAAEGGYPAVQKYMQGVSTIGTFMLPALFAAYLFSENPERYLRLHRFSRRPLTVVILIVLLTLSATAVSDAFYRVSKGFSWPEALQGLEELVNRTEGLMAEQMERILMMNSFQDFLSVFFVMAVLPAVCEETLFRGVLQPILKKATGKQHLGVWLAAFCFALLHLQFYTFLSIFILGAVMGYLKEWTGSLWTSMLMHLLNNGSIVVAIYFFGVSYEEVNQISGGWDYGLTVAGMAIFSGCLVALYRLGRR